MTITQIVIEGAHTEINKLRRAWIKYEVINDDGTVESKSIFAHRKDVPKVIKRLLVGLK